ncbi:40527_t:CDS:2, partial [Gigaspora margarita]
RYVDENNQAAGQKLRKTVRKKSNIRRNLTIVGKILLAYLAPPDQGNSPIQTLNYVKEFYQEIYENEPINKKVSSEQNYDLTKSITEEE